MSFIIEMISDIFEVFLNVNCVYMYMNVFDIYISTLNILLVFFLT